MAGAGAAFIARLEALKERNTLLRKNVADARAEIEKLREQIASGEAVTQDDIRTIDALLTDLETNATSVNTEIDELTPEVEEEEEDTEEEEEEEEEEEPTPTPSE